MGEVVEEFLVLAGARVRVVSWGTGPVVLCVHGLGGGTHFFSALGPLLADSWRTVALDLPGSGLSPARETFTFEQCAEVVGALAAHMGPPVHLVGHSLGTIIALEVVRRCAVLVAGMVAVGGLPEPLPRSRARIRARADVVRERGLTGLGREVASANFSQATIGSRPELTGLFAALFERQDARAYAQTAHALAAWEAPPLPPFGGIRCLTIIGAEDLYAPPEAVRAFARQLPSGTRVEVMDGCGHLPMLERPAEFARILREFLEAGSPGPGTTG